MSYSREAGYTRGVCHVCGVKVNYRAIACGRHLHAAKRQRRERACATCAKRYIPHDSIRVSRYCSIDCYRVVQHKRPAIVEATCSQCGATFRRTRAAVARVKRSFCSEACARTFNSGPRSAVWRGGTRRGYRGPGWQRIAESVRERDGRRCRRCGKAESDEGRRLSVDHVIPYRTFESSAEANDIANLVALCGSCHGKKARAERLWLKGDVLDMWSYQVAVAEPWRERSA